MRNKAVNPGTWSSRGRGAVSLPAVFAMVSAGICVGACGGSSGGTSDAGASEAGKKDAASPDGGGSSGVGFAPSNIACAVTTSAIASAASAAGIDLSQLGDVDLTPDNDPSITSDTNVCDDPASCASRFAFKSSTNSALIFTTVQQSNGAKVGVYIANSWTVEKGASLALYGTNPIALVALKDITVDGTIDGTGALPALGQTPPGGFPAASGSNTTPGEGPGGGPGGTNATPGAGGGGASYCGKGGPGGGGTVTAATYGTSALIPLVGGSSGGTQYGGEGGGAIQLVAGGQISVSGVVTAGGAGGNVGSGGAGSGGGILLEAPVVTVTGVLAANGGGGGSNGDANSGANGEPNATPAPGGTNSGGVAGGEGSAGATLTGTSGVKSPTGEGGGGGGGAGFIRINTKGASATVSGTVSPAKTTQCFSQGSISSTAPSCK